MQAQPRHTPGRGLRALLTVFFHRSTSPREDLRELVIALRFRELLMPLKSSHVGPPMIFDLA